MKWDKLKWKYSYNVKRKKIRKLIETKKTTKEKLKRKKKRKRKETVSFLITHRACKIVSEMSSLVTTTAISRRLLEEACLFVCIHLSVSTSAVALNQRRKCCWRFYASTSGSDRLQSRRKTARWYVPLRKVSSSMLQCCHPRFQLAWIRERRWLPELQRLQRLFCYAASQAEIQQNTRCTFNVIWLSRIGAMTALFFTQTRQSLQLQILSVCLSVRPNWTDGKHACSFFVARSPPHVASINPYGAKMT